jgi:ubiquinone/menaquinone biosynthesis C-methylase UbiE
LSLVESKKGKTTWEWDDEKFWAKQYQDQLSRREDHDRNDRLWQRAPMVEKLLEGFTLEEKVILSLGSGDGNNFRTLFLNHCDEDTLYIAQDISFNGLALNRQLNPHKQAIYLLCSCDYELPIVSNFVDVIVYFGILHHTRMKDKNITKDKRLLKKQGYVMLHEALDRPESFFSKMFEEEKSEHEEYISKKKTLKQFSNLNGFRIILKREDSTPFYTFFMLFFRKTMINNKRVFDAILYVDKFIARTLGRLSPYFDAGCLAILAEKTEPN